MKKPFQIGWYLMFITWIVTCPVLAQNMQKELASLAKKYEKAYNQEDVKSLLERYTNDAVRVLGDGRTFNGIAEIEANMVSEFEANDFKVSIESGNYEVQSDGTVISHGTYHVTGMQGSEKVEFSGKYTNTMVKVGGDWKVSKSVLQVD